MGVMKSKILGVIWRNITLGASDGLVTTYAIIAGSAGANMESRVIVVLGLAKLIADALSMAAGVYLGVKSEIECGESLDKNSLVGSPIKQGAITFFAFLITGSVPLSPYLLNLDNNFTISAILLGITLFAVGSIKAISAKRAFYKGGLEMLAVGGIVSVLAYLIGFVVESLYSVS